MSRQTSGTVSSRFDDAVRFLNAWIEALLDYERLPGSDFVGIYAGKSAWSDALVVVRDGALGVLWIKEGLGNPTSALVRLAHVEGGVFRQQEPDGTHGKHYILEPDETGGVWLRFNNNILTRQDVRERRQRFVLESPSGAGVGSRTVEPA